ncbi:MAG: hypothetical protein IJ766_02480 [Clostridia bacterium]|nr:hypothetical protein [Clostridia bacterium]
MNFINEFIKLIQGIVEAIRGMVKKFRNINDGKDPDATTTTAPAAEDSENTAD